MIFGMEQEGLKLLSQSQRSDWPVGIVTEVMSDRDVELVAEYADVLQIGARNVPEFLFVENARQDPESDPVEAPVFHFNDQG